MSNGALESALVSQGRQNAAAFSPPSNSYVYGFRSLELATGVAARYCAIANFAPVGNQKGVKVSACIRKFTQNTDYSPCIFVCATPSGSAEGYILGLSKDHPYRIILARTLLQNGLVEDAGSNLGESEAAYYGNVWHHLRMMVGINTQGDVDVIADLDDNDPIVPAAPNWVAIPGIDDYVDDQLGILQGTPGLTGDFYVGIGHYNGGGTGRVSLFDYVKIARQTNP